MTDLFSLAGRSELIAGGSRGIGRMIATGFLMATMWSVPPWWWTAASRWPVAEGKT